MSRASTLWAGLIGVAALVLSGCVAETDRRGAALIDDVYDPGFPARVDAGMISDDAGPTMPLPDTTTEQRTADVPEDAEEFVGCGGATSWRCPEGTVCCPATQECVPAGDCASDAYHRFMTPDSLDPESLPDVNPVGPTPEGEDGEPRGEPEDPDPGPMPPS